MRLTGLSTGAKLCTTCGNDDQTLSTKRQLTSCLMIYGSGQAEQGSKCVATKKSLQTPLYIRAIQGHRVLPMVDGISQQEMLR